MKNLESIAEELFNKIRGRFPTITVGDDQATITNKPGEARFFEFDFAEGKKVNVNIDQDSLTIMYAQNLFSEQEHMLKSKWFDFLKELRVFAKKRMLNFDTRDITKSNLDKRDYDYLRTEKQMSESKMYGTSRTSYQDIGTARLVVKHAGPVNHENAAGRTQNVHSIYIESENGERFRYPLRHMNGARAMAMHVSEGGNAYDDFGKHIVGLSEEMNKLRKFKTYMNRSSVMAEGLAGYMDVVNERLATVKKTVESLQRKAYYTETFANFETTVLEEVPEDVSNTWIDELTIKQFNEELKGVFPYVYNLVKEANKVQEIGLEEIGGMSDVHIDAQEMDRESFVERYPTMGDLWDEVHADDDDDMGAPNEAMSTMEAEQYHCKDCGDTMHEPTTNCEHDCHDEKGMHWIDDNGNGIHDADEGVIDPEVAYAETLDKLIADAMHEQDPMENKTPNESQQLDENPLKWIVTGAAKLAGNLGVKKRKPGLDAIAKIAKDGLKKSGTVAKDTAKDLAKKAPGAAKDAAVGTAKIVGRNKGKTAVGVGGVVAYNKAKGMLDKIPTMEELMELIPGITEETAKMIAEVAKRYALPVMLILIAIYGGFKLLGWMFGEDADTVDISPKGNGDELKQKNEVPLEEFIKSMYDYTTNGFPKGETAVLTAVQKQYGEDKIGDAQTVITELLKGQDREMARVQQLAGLR